MISRLTLSPENAVRALIGLGNPGKQYADTYHNAGQLAVRHLLLHASFPHSAVRSTPLFRYARLGGILLVETRTFMNESGKAVGAVLRHFRLAPEEIAVLHDESDLPIGQWRLSFGRGAAGHKGVVSTIASLGTSGFWRLRIGVRGRLGKAGSFVLKRIAAEDRALLYSVFDELEEKLIEKVTPSGPRTS